MLAVVTLFAGAAIQPAGEAAKESWAGPPPEAYIDPVDAEIARTGIGREDRPEPCRYRKKKGDFVFIEGSPVEKCVKMEAPQRWVGLWRSEFEGSQFCDQATVRCDFDVKPRVWLNILPCGKRCSGKMELFRVEFIGRRTVYPGTYGHLGGYDHYIIADRVISIEPVKDERPGTTAGVE